MVHEELAAAVEQLGQGPLAALGVEDVLLVDLYPGQRAAGTTQVVPRVGECALLAQQVEPRREPNVARDDGRVHGVILRSMFNELV